MGSIASSPFTSGKEGASRRRWRNVKLAAYVIVAIIGFSVAFSGSLIWGLLRGVTNPPGDGPVGGDSGDVIAAPRPAIRPDEPLNILLLGTDAGLSENGVRGRSRSDVIMLLSIDPLTNDVSLISLPRDTRVTIPGDRVRPNPTRLGHAYAYGGPELAVATVSSFLDVPIHRYVSIGLDAFVNVVDILGGVELCVEKDMYYEDPYQDLLIDLKKGCRRLNGHETMQYVRYRQDSDLHRIQRQQKFLTAIAQEALQLSTLTKLPRLIETVTAQLTTDLTQGELLNLLGLMGDGFSVHSVKAATIPGGDLWLGESGARAYYYAADERALRRLVEELVWRLAPPGEDKNNDEDSQQETRPGRLWVALRGDPAAQDVAGDIQEEIASLLGDYGHYVYRTSPAGSGYAGDGITVILHDGNDQHGKLLARYIAHKFTGVRIYEEVDEQSMADLTIIVNF